MLANGIKLKVKVNSSFVELPDLKTVPDMGVEIEKVENSALGDAVKQYESGIGDAGDLDYVFRYKNTSANDSYRILSDLEGSMCEFQHIFPDGLTFDYSAYFKLKVGGGGVNDPIEFTMSMALQSDFEITQPSIISA